MAIVGVAQVFARGTRGADQIKIDKLGRQAIVERDVLRFEDAMDEPGQVRGVQTFASLAHHLKDFGPTRRFVLEPVF